MKLILYFLFISFLNSNIMVDQDSLESPVSIKVNISNIKSDKGTIHVGLYSTQTTWLRNPLYGKIAQIENGLAYVEFEGLEKGEYAISLFHDENDNEKLDTGWFGIPKEPYACSNGAKGKFGPPKWDDAVFKYDNKLVEQTIKL